MTSASRTTDAHSAARAPADQPPAATADEKLSSAVRRPWIRQVAGLLAIVVFLGWLQHRNYLLFHTLVELATVVVGFTICLIVWNARDQIDNRTFMALAIGYGFVSVFDFLHALAYKGMGIFSSAGTDLATQVWIAARYLESSAFLAGLYVVRQHRLRMKHLFAAYALAASLLFLSIFYWDLFPTCFREETGLTPFKVISEGIVIALLALALWFARRHRESLHEKTYGYVASAIVLSMAAELMFTLYSDVYGLTNMLGHILKLASFFLIYKGLVENALRSPYNVLFRNLKRSEEALAAAHLKLEERVRERTRQLRQTVTYLRSEIEQRRQAEDELHRNEQRFRLALSNAPIAVFHQDRSLCYNWVYDSGTGLLTAEAMGKTDFDLLPASDAARVASLKQKVIDTSEPLRTEISLPVQGGTRHYDMSLEPLLGEQGDVIGITCATSDITIHKEQQDQLQQRTLQLDERVRELHCLYQISRLLGRDDLTLGQVFEQLVSVIPQGWRHPEKTAARIMFQHAEYTSSNYRHSPWMQISDLVVRGNLAGTVEIVYLGSVPPTGETPFLAEETRLIDTIATDVSRKVERRLYEQEIRALNRDLEERVQKRTEKLENANRELEAFTYSVSHDLRAPLRSVTGFSRILAEDYQDVLDAEGKRILGVILDGGQRMERLISDLLELSRVGRREAQLTEVDLTALVNEIIDEQRSQLAEDRDLTFEVSPLPPARGDRNMLRQVFDNLVGNAVKFTRETENAIVRVDGEQCGDHVTYHVSDNGAGFDMHYAERLFQVFQRLHSSTEFEGTGVGLAIVARIVEHHGGRVRAEGEPGRGATFHIALPLREEAQNAPT